MRMEHPPHSLIGFAQNLTRFLDGHLAHQRQGEGFEFLAKMFAAPFPRRSHPINFPILTALASRQRADNHALLIEDVEMPPLHRLDMIVTRHWMPVLGAFLRPNGFGFLHANHKCVLLRFILGAGHSPARS